MEDGGKLEEGRQVSQLDERVVHPVGAGGGAALGRGTAVGHRRSDAVGVRHVQLRAGGGELPPQRHLQVEEVGVLQAALVDRLLVLWPLTRRRRCI